MHIAIDDTYGKAGDGTSVFVTEDRRTHVAVVFPDDQVDEIRDHMRGLLSDVSAVLATPIQELHFTDIYNRRGPWRQPPEAEIALNMVLFKGLAEVYADNRWRVHVQTIDHRTIPPGFVEELTRNHPDHIVDGLDMMKFDDLSLIFLLIKIRHAYRASAEPLTLIVDEGGPRKAGTSFGQTMFGDWNTPFLGYYESSTRDPLLQLADFLAFSINRATHLSYKDDRTPMDLAFLKLVASMRINSADLIKAILPRDFKTVDVDAIHAADRNAKDIR